MDGRSKINGGAAITTEEAAITAETAITGITDQQLATLNEGGWRDDYVGLPGWTREFESIPWMQETYQSVDGRWNAHSCGAVSWWNSFDEALAWCDRRAGDRKPAKAGSATKQEDRFVRMAAGG